MPRDIQVMFDAALRKAGFDVHYVNVARRKRGTAERGGAPGRAARKGSPPKTPKA